MSQFLFNAGRSFMERKSYVALISCFGFTAGIIAHSCFNFKFDFFWIYNALLLFGVLILIFWQSKKIRLILIGVFFILLGFARFDLGIEKNKILSEYWEKDARIIGLVNSEPINKIDKQQLIIKPMEIKGEKFLGREQVLVTTNLYPEYSYGDKLELDCKLARPKKFETFDYARYLSVQNIYGLCYYPSVAIADFDAGSEIFGFKIKFAMAQLLRFKKMLINKINQNLHEPFASFLSGLVVGAKNAIPQDLLNNFQRTGTTHIIAISGWNITFLGLMFLPILFHFGIKRQYAFYIMVAIIILFVFFVGAQASVIRAGIMGILALWASITSRYNHAGRALLYSIVIMFLINSHIVYDVGFWLSVCATFGLIYFSPIAERLLNTKKLKIKLIEENLKTTVSAVIFTMPVSMFCFGNISLWALVVNIIILPFIAYAIIFAILVLPIMGLVPQIISQILFLPSAAILNFIIKVINLFGNIPFGYVSFKINFLVMLILYGAILYFTFYKWEQLNEEQ